MIHMNMVWVNFKSTVVTSGLHYCSHHLVDKKDMPMDRGGPQKEKTLVGVEMPTMKLISN